MPRMLRSKRKTAAVNAGHATAAVRTLASLSEWVRLLKLNVGVVKDLTSVLRVYKRKDEVLKVGMPND